MYFSYVHWPQDHRVRFVNIGGCAEMYFVGDYNFQNSSCLSQGYTSNSKPLSFGDYVPGGNIQRDDSRQTTTLWLHIAKNQHYWNIYVTPLLYSYDMRACCTTNLTHSVWIYLKILHKSLFTTSCHFWLAQNPLRPPYALIHLLQHHRVTFDWGDDWKKKFAKEILKTGPDEKTFWVTRIIQSGKWAPDNSPPSMTSAAGYVWPWSNKTPFPHNLRLIDVVPACYWTTHLMILIIKVYSSTWHGKNFYHLKKSWWGWVQTSDSSNSSEVMQNDRTFLELVWSTTFRGILSVETYFIQIVSSYCYAPAHTVLEPLERIQNNFAIFTDK